MTKGKTQVNGVLPAGIAPLRNVALFHELIERLAERAVHLPGMGAFSGYSDLGKSFSATYGANVFKAFYVEVGESWTKKKFCERLLQELGVAQPRGTIPDLVEQIIELLSMLQRPLIIDEFDFVVQRGYVEMIREIHDKAATPIILIGEEHLPRKLERWERFHNRVLTWVMAQPADRDDARHLANLYCDGIEVADDLLDRIVAVSRGGARRIVVNLAIVAERARTTGAATMTLADFGEGFFTGRPPARAAA